MAAISGWCGIKPPAKLPEIWALVKKHQATAEDLQRILVRSVKDTAYNMHMEIHKFHFTDDMLKDIKNINVAPGGNEPVWHTLQRGICILNCLPKSATQVALEKRTEENYRDTAETRTFAEAEKKGKGQPRMPADDYESLKKNVTTYGMYLLAFFGKECPHYQGVWYIRC